MVRFMYKIFLMFMDKVKELVIEIVKHADKRLMFCLLSMNGAFMKTLTSSDLHKENITQKHFKDHPINNMNFTFRRE